MTSYPQVTCFFDLHLNRILWNLYIFEYVMSDMWFLNPVKIWTVCETAERQIAWFLAHFVVAAIFAKRKTVLFVIEIYYRRSSDIHISRVAHPKNKLIPFRGDVSWRQQIWTAVGISVVDEYSVQWCLSLVGHARKLLFDLQTHIRVPICIFEALKVILRSK